MSAEKISVSKRDWALFYRAAVSEADDKQRLHLIARAKGAIFERQRALSKGAGHALEERHALEDAAYVLAALRKAAEFNLQARKPQSPHLQTGTR
jgi:hypothetical protein